MNRYIQKAKNTLSKHKNKKNKIGINYLFFGLYFSIVLLFAIANIFLVENSLPGTRSFFLLHAILQAFLEVGILITATYYVEKYLARPWLILITGLIFLYLLIHVVDFILIRIMDLSIYQTIDLVLAETWENFKEMLVLSGIPILGWISLAILALLLIPIGYLFYRYTSKICHRKKLFVALDHIWLFLFCVPTIMFIWDMSCSFILHPDIANTYYNTLPWKTTFYEKRSRGIHLIYPLKRPIQEETIVKKIQNVPQAIHHPNIYLFIIESLREDYITEENTPHLFRFKDENLHFDLALANANGTQQSWYSIIHSSWPLYWNYREKGEPFHGGAPLRILKQNGYKLHVHTASQLSYYRMNERLFGKKLSLLDDFHHYPHYAPIPAWQTDHDAIEVCQNQQKSESDKKGLFILFLDSTHFNYSWPDAQEKIFTPYGEARTSLTTIPNEKDLLLIKNRYKNSLYHVDRLIGGFIDDLKKKNLYDDAIIVIAADHGEEFFEHGHLFHGSHLSNFQTEIPLYMKFPKKLSRDIPKENLKMITHVDIFPSILDYLYGKDLFSDILDGESIFQEEKWPFVISSRYNMSLSPEEFFIHNGNEKLLLRFTQKRNIYQDKRVEILSIKDRKDRPLIDMSNRIIQKKFQKGLERIFPYSE